LHSISAIPGLLEPSKLEIQKQSWKSKGDKVTPLFTVFLIGNVPDMFAYLDFTKGLI
jgi:hypothetical protein